MTIDVTHNILEQQGYANQAVPMHAHISVVTWQKISLAHEIKITINYEDIKVTFVGIEFLVHLLLRRYLLHYTVIHRL